MTIRPEGSAPRPTPKLPLPRPRRRFVDTAVIGPVAVQALYAFTLILLVAAAVHLPACPAKEPVNARAR